MPFTEEVRVGNEHYIVAYDERIDQSAMRVKCPKCKRKKSAVRVVISLIEAERVDDATMKRELVTLDNDLQARMERALIRKLLQDGDIVAPTLFCRDCTLNI